MSRQYTTGKPRDIHQILVSATPEDAVFNFALLLRGWLRGWGFRSEIFAESVDPRLPSREVRELRNYSPRGEEGILIYHYSTGSSASAYVRELNEPTLLIYHNVTPSEFFRGVQQQLYESTHQGKSELAQFASVSLALSCSEFSRKDLVGLGFKSTGVLPLCIDETRCATPPSAEIIGRFDDGATNLLFVGRVVPNKRIEDVIRTFYYYKRIDPAGRLLLVGPWDLTPRYKLWLDGYVRQLGLGDVHFCGRVPTAELVAYYRLGDVFVCMSEHEGFCLPLVESMHFDVPIVAYAAAAVPETLGEAGILVRRKEHAVIAEAINLVVTDDSLRARMLAQQRRQATEFSPQAVKERFRDHLQSLLSAPIKD